MGYVASSSAFTAGSGVFVDTFTAGVDYTAGSSSQVTLSNTPASPNAVWVFFNGVAQHHSQYSVNGNVVSFTSAIPTNVSEVQVQVNTQLAVGVPGPATVEYSSLTSAAKTTLQRKNAIINGNFDIWQRGTSSSSTGYQTADRWATWFAGTGVTHSVSQQAFAVGQTAVPNEPIYFMRNTFTSGSDAGTIDQFYQGIEDARTFAGKTVTVSFWAKAASALNMTVELEQYFGTGGSPSTSNYYLGEKVSLTTSWQRYTITVNLTSDISGKTFGSDNNDGLYINFWMSAGSTYNSRSDTLGLQSGTIDIAQVQIEEGDTATQFERKTLAEEYMLCYRYYYALEKAAASGYADGASQTARCSTTVNFPVEMRGVPAVSTANITSSSSGNVSGSFPTAPHIGTNSAILAATATAAGSMFWYVNGGYIEFDAEIA